MDDHGSPVLARLLAVHGDVLLATHAEYGDATAIVRIEAIVELMCFARDDAALRFEMLMDLTAVDHVAREPRFDVVYHLYSIEHGHRLRIKLGVSEATCAAPSLIDVWPGAAWLEREVWDMYGLRFRGHPDLRRILMYEGFEGHPLRKDYPVNLRQPLIGPTN